MDSERAERHLRLVAEAGLRQALALPRHDGEVRPRDVFSECTARLHRVAAALVAVSAVDDDRAEAIMDQFQAALGVRHLHHITASPRFGPAPRSPRGPGGPPQPGPPAAASAQAAGPGGPGGPGGPPGPTGPVRVIPVGRMLPFGDENVIGELYVMSLVLTARQARPRHGPDAPGRGREHALPRCPGISRRFRR